MKDFWKYFVPVGIFVILGWLAWWKWAALHIPDSVDRFSGVNALFAGLAFAGVVTAVILQSHELSLQRNELELTREELKKAAEANQAMAKALTEQIHIQLRAAELSSVSTLLSSVNSQLGPGGDPSPEGDSIRTLMLVRKAYHQRLHDVLGSMGRGITLPQDCKSVHPVT
jgi:hypothetical protein